jgi:hypothetical protein
MMANEILNNEMMIVTSLPKLESPKAVFLAVYVMVELFGLAWLTSIVLRKRTGE